MNRRQSPERPPIASRSTKKKEVEHVQNAKRHGSRRQPVVVLGMHRSGTSALGGMLVRLGVQPPESLMAPTKDNPKGYWESTALMQFNNDVLESAGTSWSDWDQFNPAWLDSTAARQFIERLPRLLEQEFADAPLFLVKDPRICRVLPLWRRVMQDMDMAPRFVVPVRHPFEVASSLEARDDFGRNRSYLIWLRHMLDAEHDSRDCQRVFVNYADMLRNWRADADRMSRRLDITWPKWSGSVEADIDAFLTTDLRHHATVDTIPAGSRGVAQWVARAYDAFLALLADEPNSADAYRQLDGLREELNRSGAIFASVLREGELRSQAKIRGLCQRATEANENYAELLAEVGQVAAVIQSAAEKAEVQTAMSAPSALDFASAHKAALATLADQLRAITTHMQSAGSDAREIASLTSKLEASHSAALDIGSGHALALTALEEKLQAARDLLLSTQSELRQKDERLSHLEQKIQRSATAHAEQAGQYLARMSTAEAEMAEARLSIQSLNAALDKAQKDMDERFVEIARLTELLMESGRRLDDAKKESQGLSTAHQKAVRELRAQLLRQQEETLRVATQDQNRIAVMSERLGQADLAIAAIRNSRSWRLTKPLRRLLGNVDKQAGRKSVLASELKLVRASEFFDEDWYLKTYPDVASSRVDPILHYLECGAGEFRNPSIRFDTREYVEHNPDIIATGENPLIHYLLHG
jgi:hypothetical protein